MPIGVVNIKNRNDNKWWYRYGERGMLIYFICECKVIQLLWNFLRITRNKTTMWFSSMMCGNILENFISNDRDVCMPMFVATLLTITRKQKQLLSPLTDKWIARTWYIYTMGFYSLESEMKFQVSIWGWKNGEIM